MIISKRKGIGMLGILCMVLSPAITSCDKDEKDPERYTLHGDATSSQETPPVTSDAMGTITGTYDADSNMLRYTIFWTGLSSEVTAAHFHGPAETGESAGPIIPISLINMETSGSTMGSIEIPDSTENFLRDGKLYYNIHTSMHADGEIRGQISLNRN